LDRVDGTPHAALKLVHHLLANLNGEKEAFASSNTATRVSEESGGAGRACVR
jgi:hypothetical protein